MSDRGSRRHVVRTARVAAGDGRAHTPMTRAHRASASGADATEAGSAALQLDAEDRPTVVRDRLEVVHQPEPRGSAGPRRMQARYLLVAGDLAVAVFYLLLSPSTL